MAETLRLFQSTVDPADVEKVRRLFVDDILPVYDSLPGCLGIELVIRSEPNAGGLVEGAALSRWESRQAMEEAMASRPVQESQVRIFELLRQEPVVRVFEVLA
ncbi:MAG: antibiotic biosynthesis monooxygenase [Actinomycetota bacterium]|nr:antibiotic biosynthesis monooxygenase [Actinomycetota bacterium]